MSTHDTLSGQDHSRDFPIHASRGQDGSWEVLRNGLHYRNTDPSRPYGWPWLATMTPIGPIGSG